MGKFLHISNQLPYKDTDSYLEEQESLSDHSEIGVKFICDNKIAGLIRYDGSTGYDLVYPYPTPITIPPGEIVKVPCGFKLVFPPEVDVNIRSRSGLALKHGAIVLIAPGTSDSSYRGEIAVVLLNVSKKSYTINPGDRISQMCFNYIRKVQFYLTKKLDSTSRNEGGFGSTGR